MKSPEDMHKLIVDTEAAVVVKRIYQMKDSGMSMDSIAKALNHEGIPSPSEYKKRFEKKQVWGIENQKNFWNKSMIFRILDDERYIGNMVSGQTRVQCVGGKAKPRKHEDYIIVENTHEAIIDKELFFRVRPGRTTAKKKNRPKLLLCGLLRCSGCNHILEKYGTYPHAMKYRCSSLKVGYDNNCCHETFKEQELNEVVIRVVKSELQRAADLIKIKDEMRNKEKAYSKRINTLNKKIKGLKQRKIDTYIKLTKNKISETEFFDLKQMIECDIEKCEKELADCKVNGLSEADEVTINLFEKYINTTTFTNEMLKCLIKTIYVYDDKHIEIKWNYKEKVI